MILWHIKYLPNKVGLHIRHVSFWDFAWFQSPWPTIKYQKSRVKILLKEMTFLHLLIFKAYNFAVWPSLSYAETSFNAFAFRSFSVPNSVKFRILVKEKCRQIMGSQWSEWIQLPHCFWQKAFITINSNHASNNV